MWKADVFALPNVTSGTRMSMPSEYPPPSPEPLSLTPYHVLGFYGQRKRVGTPRHCLRGFSVFLGAGSRAIVLAVLTYLLHGAESFLRS